MILVATLAAGCGDAEREAERAAERTFAEFQRALFAGDRAALRAGVTEESRPAIDGLPLAELGVREPLRITGARDACGSWHVGVTDPGDGDAPGTYVVVRENGKLVVDLIASAALAARDTGVPVVDAPFEPHALTPADHDRLRRMQLEGTMPK